MRWKYADNIQRDKGNRYKTWRMSRHEPVVRVPGERLLDIESIVKLVCNDHVGAISIYRPLWRSILPTVLHVRSPRSVIITGHFRHLLYTRSSIHLIKVSYPRRHESSTNTISSCSSFTHTRGNTTVRLVNTGTTTTRGRYYLEITQFSHKHTTTSIYISLD